MTLPERGSGLNCSVVGLSGLGGHLHGISRRIRWWRVGQGQIGDLGRWSCEWCSAAALVSTRLPTLGAEPADKLGVSAYVQAGAVGISPGAVSRVVPVGHVVADEAGVAADAEVGVGIGDGEGDLAGGVELAGAQPGADAGVAAADLSSPAFFGPGFYRPLHCFLAFQPGVVNFLRCAISES